MQLYRGQQSINRRKEMPPRHLARVVFRLALTGGVVAALCLAGYVGLIAMNLPKVDRLADYHPPVVSQVFGDDGSLVGEFYQERRIVVPVDKIPRKLIQAFVAAEDSNFFRHGGIDYLGILRAAFKNLVSLRKKEGASTITQQVAKSMLLTPEKSFTRKIKEAILARRMEQKLSKDEILYIYLNQIYLGAGSYGVEAAAETYFGKDVDQLNLAEMAMLAGLPKAPNSYSPIKHLDRARERQRYVLDRMVKEGFVTPAEAQRALNTPIVIQSKKKVNSEESAYFLEQVRIQLEAKYGEDRLYKGGLKIYTTMDAKMQKAAYEAVERGLKEVDKRQGFRGAIRFLAENEVDGFCKKIEDGIDTVSLKPGTTYLGVVTAMDRRRGDVTVRVGDRLGTLTRRNMAWAGRLNLVNNYGKPDGHKGRSLALGAVIEVSVLKPEVNKSGAVLALDQEPQAQAALVAIDPRTGGIRAMIGGYDFKKSQFNRATQARRNPGSAFKPIIYAAAIDKKMTPASIIDDSPVEYDSGKDKVWMPHNYDNIYRGPVTMREALTESINVVSVKILQSIGTGYAIDYAKKLGISSPLENNLTLALGASSVTLLELTNAYAVFDDFGYRVTPYMVTKVVDPDGKVLEEELPPTPPVFTVPSSAAKLPVKAEQKPSPDSTLLTAVPVISPETAYVMTNLMESVVASGTGQRAKALGRPVAGKTGTTNDMKDAWFVGYVPQLVAGVWVGYDQERSLGAGGSGGQAAAPIWTDFMQHSLTGTPTQDFSVPGNVTFALINPSTGLLAREGTPGAVQECFISGTEPTTYDSELRNGVPPGPPPAKDGQSGVNHLF